MQPNPSVSVFLESDPTEDPWVQGKPSPEILTVVEPNVEWPRRYAQLAEKIRACLGERAIDIHHVGSTAVHGLPSKDVIDIDLIVPDPGAESNYIPALQTLGFVHTVREPSWYQHRMLRLEEPRVNLHVFGQQADEAVRHLLFRDWLRHHPEDSDRYASAKKQAVTSDPQSVTEYNERKHDVVRSIYSSIFAQLGLNPLPQQPHTTN
ncbi:GrpB family protein [Rhodococcus qingshengii]|uniref:GrpB family protein n=1 Tax=Rhodococcus qingshengii TaxID=334542 RepID=UPI0036D92AB0